MRPLLLLVAALGALAFVASSAAATSYCSPTGDYCTSAARAHGLRYLQISTFSFRDA
jgi:hypothetical protein